MRLGDDGKRGLAYDLDLGRPIGAWAGKFTTEMNLMSRGDYPTAIGETIFVTGDLAGFEPDAAAPALTPARTMPSLAASRRDRSKPVARHCSNSLAVSPPPT